MALHGLRETVLGGIVTGRVGRAKRASAAARRRAAIQGGRSQVESLFSLTRASSLDFLPGQGSQTERKRIINAPAVLATPRLSGSGLAQSSSALVKAKRAQFALFDTPSPGFLAGRGFSLQPVGFNLALAEARGIGARRKGGFLIDAEEATRLGFGSPSGRAPSGIAGVRRSRNVGSLILTGIIPRQKLGPGGRVLPPDAQTLAGKPIASARDIPTLGAQRVALGKGKRKRRKNA